MLGGRNQPAVLVNTTQHVEEPLAVTLNISLQMAPVCLCVWLNLHDICFTNSAHDPIRLFCVSIVAI